MSMFCYQCEQAAKGEGCTSYGVCGKDPETAALQDLLVHLSKGIASYAWEARRRTGAFDPEVDRFLLEALFTTVTNVNFDPKPIAEMIWKAREMLERAKELCEGSHLGSTSLPEVALKLGAFEPASDVQGLVRQAQEASIERSIERMGEVRAGLAWMGIYGLKGAAAYADHAAILGKSDPEVMGEFQRLLSELSREELPLEDLVRLNLEVGALNLRAMEMLDEANRSYGDPSPTRVRITPIRGKAILVSGHDLRDLHELLEQTRGKGINVYTHGEMLPAHGYPKLRAYPHLVGNYGGAWQDQQREFDEFKGAILMTTNCLQKPRESYRHRIFTTGLVGWPGVRHIPWKGNAKDFSPVIEAALAEPGFEEDEPDRRIWVGFGHGFLLSKAKEILELIERGKVRHIFLIGGCDGAKPGRNYYTELAQRVPEDCLILTLACGKYRFNKLDFGEIDGLPRLMDVGQCNDAYSAVKVALELSKALGKSVNEIPLSLILSWYEQKAVAILLTLLHLGIKGIRLGPSLPAFAKPPVLGFLRESFDLKPISTPEEDLRDILG